MRNRIKGYWSWDEVGIQPSELNPGATLLPARRMTTALVKRPSPRSKKSDLVVTTFVVAGSVLTGVALAWSLGSLIRR